MPGPTAPPRPPVMPPVPPGGSVCPACAWPAPPGAVRCEMCSTPLAKVGPPVVEAAPLSVVVCRHCGEESLVDARRTPRCPECGRGFREPPSATTRLAARSIRLLRNFRLSGRRIAVGLLVVTGLSGFCVQHRYFTASTTADRMRNLRQALQIFEVENGGYPADLEVLREWGGVSPSLLVDGWERPLRYSTSDPIRSEFSSEERFARCELRSAGPNGEAGDDDDVVWQGVVDWR